MNQSGKKERRQYQRYPIQKNEAVVVSPNSIVSFCLLDISRVGLAFCYNSAEAQKWQGKRCLLDLLGENFSLADVPAKIIDDQPFSPENLPSTYRQAIVPSLRRCGVRFQELTPDQEKALKDFIEGLSAAGEPARQPSVVLKG